MKKIINAFLIICCLATIVLDCMYFYYKSIEDEIYAQQTIHAGGNFKLDDNADEDNDDWILEFVYYANKDNSGIEMLDFRLKCFSGIDCDYAYGYGMQILNPSNMSLSIDLRNMTDKHPNIFTTVTDYYFTYSVDYSNCVCSYFNTDDFVSYKATTSLNDEAHPYIIKINKEKYSFDFNYDNCFLRKEMFWGLSKSYCHYLSNFNYYIYKTFNAITQLTNTEGETEGVYENLTMEYTDIFNFYKENDGRFEDLANFTYSSSFMDLKITYVDRGAGIHSDSMFGKINLGEVANG